MLVSVSESLHETDCLVDVSSDGQVADRDMAENAFVVDDVGCSESNTIVATFFD